MVTTPNDSVVAQRLLVECARAPESLLLDGDHGPVTRGAFAIAATTRANDFRDAGLRAGDYIAVSAGRGNAFWIDLAATWIAGAVPLPLDAHMPIERRTAFEERTHPQWLIAGDGTLTPRPFARGTSDRDLAALLNTSGSTGTPRAVCISATALLGNVDAVRRVLASPPDIRLGIALPSHFTSAICHFLFALLDGATLVFTERRLLPAQLIEFLVGQNVTAFGGAPMQVRWIVDFGDAGVRGLRWMMTSGDHLPADVASAALVRMPSTSLFVAYGLTEAAGRFCILDPRELSVAAGSVGRPIPGMAVAIRDEEGGLLGPGETGDVYASGDYAATSYVEDPDATAKRFTNHGIRTGDLGFLDSAGRLWLRGRNDDEFKSAGHKVNTVVIADALLRTGLVSDVAVIGVPDPVVGASPCAYVVALEGHTIEPAILLNLLRQQLPPNHLPRWFISLPAIPRTGSGKVERQALPAPR
ncbi:MAG TPA: class I adenylate-forming enzyme family protein [Gemmatimonadaceae bacterium]|jgi:acyl-coenzyme A synthetase/AMP-(fatty) acid ligase